MATNAAFGSNQHGYPRTSLGLITAGRIGLSQFSKDQLCARSRPSPLSTQRLDGCFDGGAQESLGLGPDVLGP